jgi:uncharacterized protein (TIGR00369 family)
MTQTQPSAKEAARTFSWVSPGDLDLAKMVHLNGLEQLQAMMSGEAPRPPIMDLVDMASFHAEQGRVVVTMRVQEFHYNPLGTVHGGVIATLLDTATGCSVHSTLAVGEGYTSLDLTTKFLRPVTLSSGLLTCEGSVIQRGRRVALAQAELSDEAGRLVAHATSSCLIFPLGG